MTWSTVLPRSFSGMSETALHFDNSTECKFKSLPPENSATKYSIIILLWLMYDGAAVYTVLVRVPFYFLCNV